MHYVILNLKRIFNPRHKTFTKNPWKTPDTSLFLCNIEMWLQSYVARNPLQNGGEGGGGQREQNFPKCFNVSVWDWSLTEGEKVVGACKKVYKAPLI